MYQHLISYPTHLEKKYVSLYNHIQRNWLIRLENGAIDNNSVIYCFLLLYPDVIYSLTHNLRKKHECVVVEHVISAFRLQLYQWATKIINNNIRRPQEKKSFLIMRSFFSKEVANDDVVQQFKSYFSEENLIPTKYDIKKTVFPKMRNSIFVIKASCRIYQKTVAFENIAGKHTCTRMYPDGTVILDLCEQKCKLRPKNIPTIMRVKQQGQPTLYNFYQQTIDENDSDDNDSDSTNEFIVQNCFFSSYTQEELPPEFSQERFKQIYQQMFKAGYNFRGKSAPMSIYGSTMHAC